MASKPTYEELEQKIKKLLRKEYVLVIMQHSHRA